MVSLPITCKKNEFTCNLQAKGSSLVWMIPLYRQELQRIYRYINYLYGMTCFASLKSSLGPRMAQATAPTTNISGVPTLRKPPPLPPKLLTTPLPFPLFRPGWPREIPTTTTRK